MKSMAGHQRFNMCRYTISGYLRPARAILATTAALALGGTAFLLALRAMHVQELTDLTSAIRRRWCGRR